MAVITNEDFMAGLQSLIGERTDDEAIAFLENARDTLTDKDNKNAVDWKQKYDENDAAWRKRYMDAFYSGEPKKPDPQPDIEETPKTFKDLFKEE